MLKKVIFLIVFVPVHSFLTLLLLQFYGFNYNPNVAGLFARFCHILAGIDAIPLLMLFRAAGLSEYSPMWLQFSALAFYSLLWAVVILLIYAGIKFFLRVKGKSEGLQPPNFDDIKYTADE